MPSGIIIIDKPADWTSMDVCARLRRLRGERRVGHAGTLDPMATGVLPIFVGRATRAVEFAEGGGKTYVAGLRLGVETDTQDSTGTVLSEHPVTADRAALEQRYRERYDIYCGTADLRVPVKGDAESVAETIRKDFLS